MYRAFAEAFETLPNHKQDASFADLLHHLNEANVSVHMGEEVNSATMSVFICIDESNSGRILKDVLRVHKLLFPSSPYHSRSRRRSDTSGPVTTLANFEWTSVYDPPFLNYLDELDALRSPASQLVVIPSKRKGGPKSGGSRRVRKTVKANKSDTTSKPSANFKASSVSAHLPSSPSGALTPTQAHSSSSSSSAATLASTSMAKWTPRVIEITDSDDEL